MKSNLSYFIIGLMILQNAVAQNDIKHLEIPYKSKINDEIQCDFNAEIVCAGEYTRFHLKNAEIVDSVHWYFNDPNSSNAHSNELEPSFVFSGPGKYQVELELFIQDDPTMLKIKKEVIVLDLPRAEIPRDTLLCEDDSVTIVAKYGDLFNYEWSTGATSDRITVSKDGLYNVTASNECGSKQEWIVVKEGDCNCRYYLPSTFTPNGDYLNDIFKAVHTCDIKKFKIEIFDRWGKLMYESTDPNFNWDGSSTNYDGNAVYVYFIDMKVREDEVFKNKSLKGTITMLP